MNIHKKLDRFAQWSKEKAGAQRATTADEDFRALELEMNQRHEGMQKLHSSVNAHVKHISRRTEGDSKDKKTPIAQVGSTMSQHAQDFESTNSFGQCLATVGQANERIARIQDSYANSATNGWMNSTERSLAHLKEYQNARKRLETRRLAYDTSMNKMQKSKRDDDRAEEEFRSQRAKYDESQEDVTRRMQDVIDMEQESINDLFGFLEAELDYHERCREVLLQAKQNWPVPTNENQMSTPTYRSTPSRSRTNTLSRVTSNVQVADLDDHQDPIPWTGHRSLSRTVSSNNSPRHEMPGFDLQASGARMTPLSRVSTTESVSAYRSQLRPVKRGDVFGDAQDDNVSSSSTDGHSGNESPATSCGAASMIISRNASSTNLEDRTKLLKKAAPPPPPSRSTKPKQPPPPPMKRNPATSGSMLTSGI